MKRGKLIKMLTISLSLSLVLVVAAGVGVSVGQDGYPVADMSISPGTGSCIGDTITISGNGANPDTYVVVSFDAYNVSQLLGTTWADAAGSWTITATVPATVMDVGGTEHALMPGVYDVGANGDAGFPTTSLTVLDCATVLPATGFPTATAGLLGAGILASAAAGFGFFRYRLRG